LFALVQLPSFLEAMAPATKKNVKRAAQETKNAQEAKKAKLEPDPALQPIVDAVEAASSDVLPESCRSMLLAMLAGSLSAPADQRGAAQARVVEMIGETVEAVRTGLQEAVTQKAEIEQKGLARKEELEQTVQKTVATSGATKDAAMATKEALAEAQAAVKAAEEALLGREQEQQEGDKALDEIEEARKEVQIAIDEHFRKLCDDTLEPEALSQHKEALMPIVKKCGAAESMLISSMASFAKAPAERGDFDQVVIKEVEKCLVDRIATHTATLEAGAAAKAERAGAVALAASAVEDAKAKAAKQSEQYMDADVEQQNAQEAQRAAEEAVTELEKDIEKMIAEHSSAKVALDKFVEHNVACFNKLRNKVSTEEPGPQAGA